LHVSFATEGEGKE
jgi:hypothetical protein